MQGIRRISEISRRKETVERVKSFASRIYYNAANEQQADFQTLAKDEGIKLYFARRSSKTQYEYIFDDQILIVDENMTREQFGEVLRVEKPIARNIDSTKIATVFGRDEIYLYIREQISKGNLVRIKKETLKPVNRQH